MVPSTRSPSLTPVAPGPSSVTTPAISKPGLKGSAGFSWYFPCTISRSAKLTPMAWTATRTVPGAIGSDGSSASSSFSTGPNSRHSTARMASTRLGSERLGGPDLADVAARHVLDRRPQERRQLRALRRCEGAQEIEDRAHRHFRGASGTVVNLERDAVAEIRQHRAIDALRSRLQPDARACDRHNHRPEAAGARHHERRCRHGVEDAL